MEIHISKTEKKPDYLSMARRMLPAARAFYGDPENEQAFRAWKERREENAECKEAASA